MSGARRMMQDHLNVPATPSDLDVPAASDVPKQLNILAAALPHLAIDRVADLTGLRPLALRERGAALFADLSGFTALSRQLVEELGRRRGAERATHILNTILEGLIAPVHRGGGAVLSFSGDGFLCWFAEDSARAAGGQNATEAALACAHAMQAHMQRPMALEKAGAGTVDNLQLPPMGLKVGIAAGTIARFAVGDPQRQLLDVPTGAVVGNAVEAQAMATAGEIWLHRSATQRITEPNEGVEHPDTKRLQDKPAQRTADFMRVQSRSAELRTGTESRAGDLKRDGDPGWWNHIQQAAVDQLAPEVVAPWLPDFVWQRLVEGQSQFLAELRPAVAVFARFSATEVADTAEARSELDAYVRWAQEIFAQAGGAMIQLTLGDKGSYLYGVLGAPIQFADIAARTIRVARALALGPEQGAIPRRAQVGVAQGRMRTGEYGSSTRRTFGVQGSAVNLAARLMMLATPGEILADPAVTTLLEREAVLTPVAHETVRGFAMPVQIFRLTQTTPPRDASMRLPAPGLVLRRALMDTLQVRWAAGSTQLGVVHLVGEAGTGKSTLLGQFAHAIGVDTVYVACRLLPSGTAYSTYSELMARLLGELDTTASSNASINAAGDAVGDGTMDERGDLYTHLAHAVQANTDWAELGEDVPLAVLADALGVAGRTPVAGLSLEQRRAILVAYLQVVWQIGSHDNPRLVVLDDFHTADPESQAVVAALAGTHTQDTDHGAAWRGLLITAQRTQLSWMADDRGPGNAVVEVGPLSLDESHALVHEKLHGRADALTLDVLLQYSAGNPFYLVTLIDELIGSGNLQPIAPGTADAVLPELHGIAHLLPVEESSRVGAIQTWQLGEEVVGRLRAGGWLYRRDGAWRLRPAAALGAAELGLPDTLHQLVLSQVDRLPLTASVALRVLAVADARLTPALLAEVYPHDPDQLMQDLELLEGLGFIQRRNDAAVIGYAIVNSVVHDVVYASLLDGQRRTLHSALAHAYTQLEPLALEAQAYHRFRGQLDTEESRRTAGDVLAGAADMARDRFALETALGFVDCLLELRADWSAYLTKFELLHDLGLRDAQAALLDTLVAVPQAPPEEVALCAARYAEAVGDYAAAERASDEALALSQSAQKPGAQVEALCMLGQIARRRGDFSRAHAHYLAAGRIATPDVDALQLGEIAYGLGIAARHQGNFGQASEHLHQALTVFQAEESPPRAALALTALGILAQLERRYEAAYTLHAQALDLRRAANDWPGEGASLVSMAQLRRAQGFHAEAIELLGQAQRIHRTLRDRWWENRILNEIGVIYLIAGMLPAARTALRAGMDLAQSIGDEAGEMVLLLNLGQVERDLGATVVATETLVRSLEMAQARGEKYIQAQAHSDLARTWLYAEAPATALNHAEQALAMLEELGLESARTADWATQAEAYLMLGEQQKAEGCARCIVDTLDSSGGDGADFPQRDYWVAARVLHLAGRNAEAEAAFGASRRHLEDMANRFQDADMRASFLTSSRVNRAIAARQWDLSAV